MFGDGGFHVLFQWRRGHGVMYKIRTVLPFDWDTFQTVSHTRQKALNLLETNCCILVVGIEELEFQAVC